MVSKAFSLKRRATNVKTATSLSRHIIITQTERAPSGKARKKTLKLTPAEIRLLKAEEEAREAERLAAMTRQERQQHDALCELPDAMEDDNGWEDDILRGKTTAEISHAGEAIQDEDEQLEADEDLMDKLREQQETLFATKPRRRDPRTRRDRTQITVDAFAAQLQAMTTAYMGWSSAMSEKGLGGEYEQPEDLVMQDKEQVWVVDLFSAYAKDVPIVKGDEFLTSAYIRQGFMPTTPYDPNVLITVRALEVFRALQLRCPRLGIQAFVRGLCDLHGVPPRANLGAQFSIAFDVYLSIRAAVEGRVQAALSISRGTRPGGPFVRHPELAPQECPACMYKLEGEKTLPLPFLATMDGNNSLKRFWRRRREQFGADGRTVPGECKERDNDRVVPGDYYLPRTEVDAWAKDGADEVMRSFEPSSEEDEGAGCSEGWQNMKEDVTAVVIANKYRRALKIKQGPPALHAAMKSLGVTAREEFAAWLGKEKQYLRTLTKEPIQETMEMECYQKLVNYRDNEDRVGSIQNVCWMQFVPAAGDAAYAEAAKQTRRVETQCRHAEELAHKSLGAVQDLEVQPGITTRWMPGSEEWERAAKMVSSRRYQRALDQLQGLVVARMFELTKVNMSGTGYKLRKHIAKALQVRSKAIKSALDRYNVAAAAMTPPKPQLVWAQVVEYAFLAEFDLLHEGREDIRAEPWALPAGRAALDQHYKMLRADEEIERLNVEIARLVTYMADEEEFLVYHEERLRQEGEDALAHQVRVHRGRRGRFNAVHMERLVRLSKEPGFTADISHGVNAPPPSLRCGSNADEEDKDEDLEGIAEAFEAIVRIAHDVEVTGA
ncbi:hypothetical protein K438DRAFT_1959963 [Mycena galopus ATCC 62051]|nr:hypothetical protein K438DRAFT_1959963 [Mycena galopus ATCC 62051]